jgi:hypothetical protein
MEKKEEHLNRLSAIMQLYGDMRFKQLTLFLAWHTLAGAGIVNFGNNDFVGSLHVNAILALASILVTAVIWIMEISSTLFWDKMQKEAPEIWPIPDSKIMKIINASTAVFLLYAVNYGFWCWCSIKWDVEPWISYVLGTFGAFIFVFGVISYFNRRLKKQSKAD